MYTQCPTCATLFRITPEQLRQAGGMVRCCMCQQVFSALATVTDTLPENLDVDRYSEAWKKREQPERAPTEPPRAEQPQQESSRAPVDLDDLIGPPDVAADLESPEEEPPPLVDEFRLVDEGPGHEEPTSVPEEPEADPEPLLTADIDDDADLDQPELPGLSPEDPFVGGSTARERAAHDAWRTQLAPEPPEEPVEEPYHPFRTLLWSLGVLLLTVLLVLQYAYFMRADLARYPEARPWLEVMCSQLGCELPLRKDVSRIRILQSDVTAAPDRENALLAKALLVNEAPFPQPYPLLKLTLMDANGRPTGSRWFHPRQYLKDPSLRENLADGMPPQRPVAARLIIKDPGSGANQYQFDVK